MNGPDIWCAHTTLEDPTKLSPHPENPNKHPQNQLNLLRSVIESNGWRYPIVISQSTGFVIKGHARLQVALDAEWPNVPVDTQTYLTEADEIADMIADNRIAELSEMDTSELLDLIDKYEIKNKDIESVGMSLQDFENLTKNANKKRKAGDLKSGSLKHVKLYYGEVALEEFNVMVGEIIGSEVVKNDGTISSAVFECVKEIYERKRD